MDGDTLPYDADEEAWINWDVPRPATAAPMAPPPPVFRPGGGASGQTITAVAPSASTAPENATTSRTVSMLPDIPPTLVYEQAIMREADGGNVPPTLVYDDVGVRPTLAYGDFGDGHDDLDEFGGPLLVPNSDGRSDAAPGFAGNVDATMAYEDFTVPPTVPHPSTADAYPKQTMIAARSNAVGATQAYEDFDEVSRPDCDQNGMHSPLRSGNVGTSMKGTPSATTVVGVEATLVYEDFHDAPVSGLHCNVVDTPCVLKDPSVENAAGRLAGTAAPVDTDHVGADRAARHDLSQFVNCEDAQGLPALIPSLSETSMKRGSSHQNADARATNLSVARRDNCHSSIEVPTSLQGAEANAVVPPPQDDATRPRAPHQASNCDRRRRMRFKQVCPAGYMNFLSAVSQPVRHSMPAIDNPPAPKRPPKRQRNSAPAAVGTAAPAGEFSTTPGSRVKVKGDGWGSGTGEYVGTITEVEDLTFTVVFERSPDKWEETYVLREHCTPVSSTPQSAAVRAPLGSVVDVESSWAA